MNVIELVSKDSNPQGVLAYACGKCGTHWSSKVPDAQNIAKECCNNICTCGAIIKRKHYTICQACSDKRESEKEAKAFEAAEKIKLKDYKGEFVYHDDFSNDGYVNTDGGIDDELCDRKPEDRPKYVWACNSCPTPTPDADDVMYHILENFHEDARDSLDMNELQKLLDEWTAKQPKILGYEMTYKKAILLDDLLDEIRKEEIQEEIEANA